MCTPLSDTLVSFHNQKWCFNLIGDSEWSLGVRIHVYVYVLLCVVHVP